MKKEQRLSNGARRTLRAMFDVLIPRGVDVPNRDQRLIAFVEGFLPYMPPILAKLFPLGLWLFQWGTVLFGASLLPFSMLKPEAQRRYVFSWQKSGWPLRRQLIKGLKALVMMGYYEQPEVRQALGYEPDAYTKPLIAERAQRYRDRGLAIVTEPHTVKSQPIEQTTTQPELNRGVS